MGGDGMPRVVSHRIVVGGFKLQIMGGTQIETSKVAARSANTQKRSFKAFNCTTTTTFNLRKLIQIQIKVILYSSTCQPLDIAPFAVPHHFLPRFLSREGTSVILR